MKFSHKLDKMAIATSPLILLVCFIGMASSQEETAETTTTETSELSVKDPDQTQTDDGNSFILNAQCQVACKVGTPPNICKQPPTRKEFCESITNLDWCCQEWDGTLPELAVWFTNDCHVACWAFRICPWTRCTWCEQIDNEDRCCDTCVSPLATTMAEKGKDDLTRSGAMDTEETTPTSMTNQPSDVCPDGEDMLCSPFDGSPEECRMTDDCAYNCAAGTCQHKKDIEEQPCFHGCFNHCYDPCGCYQTYGCLYDETRGSCRTNLERYCRLTYFIENDCARKDAFYSVGGRICENVLDMGYCFLDQVIVSANLGSEKAVTDRYGIKYKPQSELQLEDPIGISMQVAFPEDQVKMSRSGEREMYATALSGEVVVCTNETWQCVDFVIPIMGLDGTYELGIRMMEGVYSDRNSRRFSAYFANLLLFNELDILAYAQQQYTPFDLFVNFRVSNNATMISVKGYKPQKLGNTTKLSFCRAHCGVKENNFLVSGFHIIKQKEYIPKDYCLTEETPDCNSAKFEPNECRRKDTFYSIDGNICWNTVSAGNCYVADVNKAVNINGLGLTDSRGVPYYADVSKHEDPMGIRKLQEALEPAEGVSDWEQPLYSRFMYAGRAQVNNSEGPPCVRYSLPLCDDGRYELNIKAADDESVARGQRKFTVLFGDSPIIQGLDLFHWTSRKNKGVDINFNFEVTEGVTKVRWRNSRNDAEMEVLPDKRISIGFCNSNCTGRPKGFIVGSFSVVRFGDPEMLNGSCTAAGQDACDCKINVFCEYNVAKNECVARKRECSHYCSDRDTSTVCRRGGDHYWYASGGVLCKNTLDTGDCTDNETLIAVNFGGESLVDSHGIMFETDDDQDYDDPGYTKEISDAPGISDRGVPPEDVDLHSSYTYGYYEQHGENPCLIYHVRLPTIRDGRYELSYKTGEVYYMAVGKRSFSLLFNEQYVVQEFEPAQERFPPDAFDLNVNFVVFGQGAQLKMDGHPPSNITEGAIPLTFCFGACSSWGRLYNPSWHMGAFSVIKFSGDIPCKDQSGSACGCAAGLECGYDVNTFDCQNRTELCQLSPKRTKECRRKGEHLFYVDSGVVCNSKHDWGNCVIEKTVFGYNFQGLAAVDSRNITYISDRRWEHIIGPPRYMRPIKIDRSELPKGVPEGDQDVYKMLIQADNNAEEDAPCIKVLVPMQDGDGSYELSIKTWEPLAQPGQPISYGIKFNGRWVVQEFDPTRIRPPANGSILGFDLVQMFRVSGKGTMLQMQGHPVPTEIIDRSAPLEYCFGSCTTRNYQSVNTNFAMTAFAVVKYQEKDKTKSDLDSIVGFF